LVKSLTKREERGLTIVDSTRRVGQDFYGVKGNGIEDARELVCNCPRESIQSYKNDWGGALADEETPTGKNENEWIWLQPVVILQPRQVHNSVSGARSSGFRQDLEVGLIDIIATDLTADNEDWAIGEYSSSRIPSWALRQED
jgi:hypothetical protein